MTSVTMQYVLWLRKKFPHHRRSPIHNVCQGARSWKATEQVFPRGDPSRSTKPTGCSGRFPSTTSRCTHTTSGSSSSSSTGARVPPSRASMPRPALTTSTSSSTTPHTSMSRASRRTWAWRTWVVSAGRCTTFSTEHERDRLTLFADGFCTPARNVRSGPAALPARGEATSSRLRAGRAGGRVGLLRKTIIILTDAEETRRQPRPDDGASGGCWEGEVEVINLRQIDIRGGCLGCCQCALDNVCVYKARPRTPGRRQEDRGRRSDRGGIDAGPIPVARWKLFVDRGFYMNHVPMFEGKQIGCLVSGAAVATGQSAAGARGLPRLPGGEPRRTGERRRRRTRRSSTASWTASPGRLIDFAVTAYLRPPTFLERRRQEAVAGRNLGQSEVRLPARPLILPQTRPLRLPQAEPQDADHRRAIHVAAADPRIPPRVPQEDQERDGQAVAEGRGEGLTLP